MEKIERDGMVAVLVSPGFGAGWSTWADGHQGEALCMDARIVQPVLDGDIPRAAAVAVEMFPGVYTGGAKDLRVEWVRKGAAFEIEEYDGSETLHVIGGRDYLVA